MKLCQILSIRSAKFQAIRRLRLSAIAILTCCICIAIAIVTPVIAKSPAWIVRSNEFADGLSKAIAAEDCQKKLSVSESLLEINPTFRACRQKGVLQTVKNLEQKLAQEKNPELHLDLEILLKVGQQTLRSYQLDEKYRVPYVDLSKAILDTLKITLNETESPSQQRQAILAKLKQYAGLKAGKTAFTSYLEQTIKTKLQKSAVVLPSKTQLKSDLKKNASQVYEIQAFLQQQKVPNYEQVYAKLKRQLFDYETFIRREILTRTENNFRLPTELYTLKLAEQGIETPIEEIIQQAHTAFIQVQQQMEAIAPQIARQKGLKTVHYRDVIQALKQEQLSAEDTLRLYQNRAEALETIIQQKDLVTLPKDQFNIRLATANENRNFPVPLYDGESSTFVIPVLQNRKKAKLYNDFTNPAMSWTLTVHEGRPGHDLQITTIKNQNLSKARTDFAFNATNVEGWATYAESMMQPYMPLEGRFMSLQFQLLRAARAFLEPELQLGKITTADALKVLTQDAGFSKFFAQQEIKRYTETFIGQAPTYFYGYQQFLKLRSQAKKVLGKKFTARRFHDFVLTQGYLTPKLLEQVLQSKM
ncbi:hypothetical protein C7B62_11945 [Pleurocapsa sp. CCALA 161]|uniref:DUF885 domain-containing protein n=1 Tax=Pleurocapsa sp. CCALA 161 TaxID=2107688 RepID=UPI000D06D543|nr:DUF885 domain-containing protein [Pleurocapsa sp. CCALA 161]PSB09756.1 hypothetical protein C7B62_11945 [Pleurocapsa sp. CCALA 161]